MTVPHNAVNEALGGMSVNYLVAMAAILFSWTYKACKSESIIGAKVAFQENAHIASQRNYNPG